jgi:hypothetical protein
MNKAYKLGNPSASEAKNHVSHILSNKIFFLIPFSLQAVQIHLANVVKLLLLQA